MTQPIQDQSSANFAVLAGSTITNTGSTVITGDVGLSPGTSITGFPPGTISGTQHITDAEAAQGQTDFTTAYNEAVGETCTQDYSGTDLGTLTLTPGVYCFSSSAQLTGTLTLDGGGDANAVFIFKTGSTLTTASSSVVSLIGSAQPCNVFWQVGSSATLGTSTTFKGNILALESATLNTSATVDGRVWAQSGAVTLDTNIVAAASCSSPPPATATLTLVKTIVGGDRIFADFPLTATGPTTITGNSATPAVTAATVDVGTYTLSETTQSGYTAESWSCIKNTDSAVIGSSITLASGDSAICTIQNTYIVPPLGGGSGGPDLFFNVPPLIDVVKIPSPLALPNGPGLVTYTYTLSNIGTVPVSDITMIDDTCSPIIFASGDTNGDSKLDVNEEWTYDCSKTLPATHTNTVTATGWANGVSATDIATATVVVGVPIVPPLIHVTKVPSPLALPAGGGMVTYTKKITNPGTVALSNVQIVDDKCDSVKYVSGDTNNDSKLDSIETWTYTCQTNLTKTTTNTVTASGKANGLTARDFAIATVIVAPPKLPNTGFAPSAK
ncbi:MAG: ice-binding family protein [Candidatus Staskawiczbacteria bacterium]|nr:ice-binding family protein [Candidatus Staskawiczbacteria bacterium]